MERTLILVKPDAFARNLTGDIRARCIAAAGAAAGHGPTAQHCRVGWPSGGTQIRCIRPHQGQPPARNGGKAAGPSRQATAGMVLPWHRPCNSLLSVSLLACCPWRRRLRGCLALDCGGGFAPPLWFGRFAAGPASRSGPRRRGRSRWRYPKPPLLTTGAKEGSHDRAAMVRSFGLIDRRVEPAGGRTSGQLLK